MKLETIIKWESVEEMKQFMTLPYPFGAFTGNMTEVAAADNAVDEVKKTKRSKKKETALADAIQETAVVEAAPMAEVPAAPVAPVTPAPAAPAPAAPVPAAPTVAATYTMDDLSKAGAALVEAGKQAEIVQILQKYGVQALPNIPAEQYAALATDFRALGAAL